MVEKTGYIHHHIKQYITTCNATDIIVYAVVILV